MLSPVAMIVCITYHASKFKETFKQQPKLQNGAALRECVHWRKKYFVLHNFKRAVVACRWFTMWCLACRGNDGWSTRNSRRSKCQLILHQRILVFWDGSCLNFSCFNHAVSAIKDVAYALDLQHEELDKDDSLGNDKSWWRKIFSSGPALSRTWERSLTRLTRTEAGRLSPLLHC